MDARERVLRDLRPMRALKSPVLVGSIRGAPFGNISELPP